MSRAIVTYAAGAHEELLDISLPVYKEFAHRHRYDIVVGRKMTDLPPAWNKPPLLIEALTQYDQVVWFDCDLVIVNQSDDFAPLNSDRNILHSLVRHFDANSEIPNSGVWIINKQVRDMWGADLLNRMMMLEVFRDHGWWEQAALMTLMGYTVPPQGTDFRKTVCRCVCGTKWLASCEFMRLCWNSHPNYRTDKPRIVHCSYPQMPQRIEVMRALVKDPYYNYPAYSKPDKAKEMLLEACKMAVNEFTIEFAHGTPALKKMRDAIAVADPEWACIEDD